MLKVLQINANRSAPVHDLAETIAAERGCHYVAYSEPNISRCAGRRVYTNTERSAAIVRISAGERVYKYHGTGCFVCVETGELLLYSAYVSPNCPYQVFENRLAELQLDIELNRRRTGKEVVVTGDFNAKNDYWGGDRTDVRGGALLEFAQTLGLVVLNDGKRPTLERTNGSSFIDVTMVSEGMASKEPSWMVLEEDPMTSDHKYIETSIACRTKKPRAFRPGITDVEKMVDLFLREVRDHGATLSPELLVERIKNAYKKSTPRVRCEGEFGMPYWWSLEVQDAIDDAKRRRRRLLRSRSNREERMEEYKEAKRRVRSTINRSKRRAWYALLEDLNEDIFGDGYRIVRSRMRLPYPQTCLSRNEKIEAFERLFMGPQDSDLRRLLPEDRQPHEAFTSEEVKLAAMNIKSGKAPGPDELPPGVVKELIKSDASPFTVVFNNLLDKRSFPDIWKRAGLVLIEKPGRSPAEEAKFRPICLLDTLAKVLESLLNQRLLAEIKLKGDFDDGQYGFRKGRSTTDAVARVLGCARSAARKRGLNALILVDVRNAFNEAAWPVIVRKLQERQISEYLVSMVVAYFQNRKIRVTGDVDRVVGGGVPQGSVLGPTLWNVLYDDIMSLKTPEGVELVCYADDLAVSVSAADPHGLVSKGDEALHYVCLWMCANGLKIAAEKTEAVLLTNKRIANEVVFDLDGTTIVPKKAVTYLGVVIDRGMIMGKHVEKVCKKARATAKALSILLPNVRGPSSSKRKMLAAAVQNVVLYCAPVWYDAVRIAKYRDMIRSVQRLMALRVIAAYRTVSTEAALVLSDMIPMDLQVEERRRLYEKRGELTVGDRRAERTGTLIAWQQQWDTELQADGPEDWWEMSRNGRVGNMDRWNTA